MVSEHLCMKLSLPGQGKKLLYPEWPHRGALASSPVLPAQSWVFQWFQSPDAGSCWPLHVPGEAPGHGGEEEKHPSVSVCFQIHRINGHVKELLFYPLRLGCFVLWTLNLGEDCRKEAWHWLFYDLEARFNLGLLNKQQEPTGRSAGGNGSLPAMLSGKKTVVKSRTECWEVAGRQGGEACLGFAEWLRCPISGELWLWGQSGGARCCCGRIDRSYSLSFCSQP